MSMIHFSKLYRRLINSPRYKRTGGVYLHEDWFVRISKRFGIEPIQ